MAAMSKAISDYVRFPSSSRPAIPGREHETPRTTYHIYFIPGNPGLISYYDGFLASLYDQLSSWMDGQSIPFEMVASNKNGKIDFEVHGNSLGGFEVGSSTSAKGISYPLGLQDQIRYVETSLAESAGNHNPTLTALLPSSPCVANPTDRIILVGHSVGAYILLELLRRRNEGESLLSPQSTLSPHQNSTHPLFKGKPAIIGGICLFPTVVDIVKSDSGRKIRWLLHIPDILASVLGITISLIVQFIALFMSFNRLTDLVAVVTGFPKDAARTTASFIKSRNGIRQALHMGREEMIQITSDCWDDKIWGPVVSPKSTKARNNDTLQPPTKLFFYFGQHDHWVADQTRDDLIASRGSSVLQGEEWRPRMEVDDMGVPHGFSIRHSTTISNVVAKYISDIVAADQQLHSTPNDITAEVRQNFPMLGF